MRNDETVGQFIRGIRESKGLTLQAVATTANMSVSFLSDIERDRRTFSAATLVDIARALRIDAEELTTRVSDQQARELREKVTKAEAK